MEGMEPRQGKHLQAVAPSAASVKGPPFYPSLALSLSHFPGQLVVRRAGK